MEKRLLLASQSPRRRELLEQAGITFKAVTGTASEETELTDPAQVVKELAARKAQSVFLLHPDDIVLGADTIVALGDEIFGKPEDADEAFEMISGLRRHTHQVYTGCAFVYAGRDGTARVITHAEKTDVLVGEITDEEIRAYIATGEPMDKAGAYAIQGRFGQYIRKIDGDYYNVVGLPLYYVTHELKKIRRSLSEDE